MWKRRKVCDAHLIADEIHIWRLDIKFFADYLDYFWSILDEQEAMRSVQYKFAVDRERFVIVRGVLKILLSQYLLLPDPTHLHIEYESQGKPRVASDLNDIDIHFNIAHSKDIALLAFSCHADVGVDIEFQDPKLDVDTMLSDVLSTRELNVLQHTPTTSRRKYFFHIWTLKEAMVKAIGCGLRQPFNDIDLFFQGDELQSSVKSHGSHWFFQSFISYQGFSSAICANQQLLKKRFYTLCCRDL